MSQASLITSAGPSVGDLPGSGRFLAVSADYLGVPVSNDMFVLKCDGSVADLPRRDPCMTIREWSS